MARVLDLDLDIFVSPISGLHRDNRPADDECEVWSEDTVRRFLEDSCRLERANPKPGLVFEEHDELFDGIGRLVERAVLDVPFDLVHVDAHADIACGQLLPVKYLLTELMYRPLNERADPTRGSGGLNRGTVLLFVAARGWLRSLAYIHHPADGKDLPEIFLGYDGDQLYFQIPRCSTEVFEKWLGFCPDFLHLSEMCEVQPEIRVPLTVAPVDSTTPTDYDFVTLTRSPGFTPPKADALFELVRSYIAPVA